MQFRAENSDLISKGTFNILKTDRDKAFAFTRSYKGETILVIGNLDYKHSLRKIRVKVPGLKKKKTLQVIEGNRGYQAKNNKLITDLEAGEIKVLRLSNFSL